MTRFLRRKYIIYIGIVIVLLPLMVLRDFTPSNELRYLSIADEALRNHTFFTFYNHGEIYADKPPFYFWLLMLCKWMTGDFRMWMLSLLSLLPALVILQVMDHWVKDEMDKEYRLLAMWMLFTSGLFLGAAVFLRMDMLMSLFIVLALREFWRMYVDGKYRWQFPLYLFLAVFTKGPFGVLIPLCATLTFLLVKKQIRDIPRFWGWRTWGVAAVLCACWFLGIYAEGGKAYLDNLLVHQTVGRAVNSFHHKEAFYYYLLHIWYCVAPWMFLVIGMLVVSLKRKFLKSDLQLFFQLTFVSAFILLSCISAKLQIYILPAIPFLVYMAVMFLPRFEHPSWMKLSLAIPAVIFALALPLLFTLCSPEEITSWGGIWLCIAVIVLGTIGLYSFWLLYGRQRRVSLTPVIYHLGMGLLLTVFFGGWAMPTMNGQIGYGTLCEKAVGMAVERQITDFRTWHLIRSENIDVYLHHLAKQVLGDSIPHCEPGKSYLLITKKKYLPQLSATSKTEVVGEYALVIFDDKNTKSNE